eukprot:124658-Amphidinium_carterae.1
MPPKHKDHNLFRVSWLVWESGHTTMRFCRFDIWSGRARLSALSWSKTPTCNNSSCSRTSRNWGLRSILSLC